MTTSKSTTKKSPLISVKDSAFNMHLDRIRTAKRRADSYLEVWNPGHSAAEAALAVSWEALFDRLCTEPSGELSLSDLNTLSGVIQKLTGSQNQIKTLELKVREQQIKEEEYHERKEELKRKLRQAKEKKQGLTEEALKEIEKELSLL